MAKAPKNMAASVRQRLFNLAREKGLAFDAVLVAFGLERLIYRLSISTHRDIFVLKGGMLVTLWTADSGRFTRDIDFLSIGPNDETTLKETAVEILSIDAGDGLEFDHASLTIGPIRKDQVYGGMRLKTAAFLEKTKIPITIDIGFGDALGDSDYTIDYASLLDFPAASVRAYSPETIMAEKFQAVVALGTANSRMKDFYDLWALPRSIKLDQSELRRTLERTFDRRCTKVPDVRPPGLSQEFANEATKSAQWQTYAKATDVDGVSLSEIVDEIWKYLEPVCIGRQDKPT